jgi:hypothetical protein
MSVAFRFGFFLDSVMLRRTFLYSVNGANLPVAAPALANDTPGVGAFTTSVAFRFGYFLDNVK